MPQRCVFQVVIIGFGTVKCQAQVLNFKGITIIAILKKYVAGYELGAHL